MDQSNFSYRLNNGIMMPALGFGTFNSDDPEEMEAATVSAIAAGYRLIDTAAIYGTEEGVGRAITRSGISRQDLFVTTKLWLSDLGYDSALRACEASLGNLGLDHVDLYLIHWPVPSAFDGTLAAWKAMIRLREEGRVRAIGVSNFTPPLLDRLVDTHGVVPAVNQIELHPLFNQAELRARHAELGIVTQAWSPLGRSARIATDEAAAVDVLNDPEIRAIADAHGKSPAQVILRWHLQHGLSAIPKSLNTTRQAENFDVFDYTLSSEDMARIDALDRGERAGFDPDVVDLNFFKRIFEERAHRKNR